MTGVGRQGLSGVGGRQRFWRPFFVLFGAGMLGVIAILPTIAPLFRAVGARHVGTSAQLMATVAVAQSALLLAIAVGVGLALAPRVGFRSRLVSLAREEPSDHPAFEDELPIALGAGVAAGLLLLGLDLAIARWSDAAAGTPTLAPRGITATIAGLLYGGITEEILIRWGLLTLLVWLGAAVAPRREGRVPAAVVWTAIVGSALAFGAGHLPAAAAAGQAGAVAASRTVILNAAGGVVFGWLYWRWSLEAAMIAHATVHVVFTLAGWGVQLGR